MKFIADFHVHSKYSRATSPDMSPDVIARWAKIKGISVMGTGDFTHPIYFDELMSKLEETGNGLLRLKNGDNGVSFLLTSEVSNIFSQNGRLRKIHTIMFAPDFDTVQKINNALGKRGKLSSDGRPVFGFPVKDLVKMVLDVSGDCLLIPAHAWTPWFSLFGSNSGFDSIEECFGEESGNIYSIETGLSSDPEMNWRLSALDGITLISNSDAHSPNKIGRESNIFDCEIDYREIVDTIKRKDRKRFLATIEFFPEEGKYHYNGHRDCGILMSPKETSEKGLLCPICRKKVTVGVMQRVDDLADRPEGFIPERAIPSVHIIPLVEIIADSFGVGVGTVSVTKEYERMIELGGSEFSILLDTPVKDLVSFSQTKVAEGIKRMREGKVNIIPGYDGVYGKISLFEKGMTEETKNIPQPGTVADQMGLF
jgi:uncharacterized protein (TIGR00375 family)